MRRRPFFSFPIALAVFAAALVVGPIVAEASDPMLEVLTPEELASAPSQRYAKMSKEDAFAELRRREVIFEEVDEKKAPGVLAPIRLTARLHGIWIHGTLSEEEQQRSPFEILDARLALSLHDLGEILERHGIDEIVHFTMYRPGLAGYSRPEAPPAPVVLPKAGHAALHAKREEKPAPHRAGTPEKDKPGSKGSKELHPDTAPKEWRPPSPSEGQTTSRHPAGLAIDVGAFKKTDGTTLGVGHDFHGKIGSRTCGAGSVAPDDAAAKELRAIVCEAQELRLFTYVLSPNFNSAHRDHLHLEIKAGAPWILTH